MTAKMIFLPVLLQVLLTVYAYVLLVRVKAQAMKAGLVNKERLGLHDDAWPDSVLKINNNIGNQFEIPILFYVLVIVLFSVGAASVFAQIVAWLFAASRVVHLIVHTGSNYVPLRRNVFTFGILMILVLAVTAAVGVLSS